MKQTEGLPTVRTLSLKSVAKMFAEDTKTRKANKSANEPILRLISLVNDDEKIITCEMGKGGTLLNRGSVVECLIKLLMKGQKTASKFGAGKVDMTKNGIKYEIKYSSSKGYATYNPKQNYEHLIFVNQDGVYEATKENIILDKCGKHIKDISSKGVRTLYEF